LILLLGYACSVVGKSEPHTFPKTVGFHGDESHGIESVNNHLKQTKGFPQSKDVHDSFGSGSKRFGAPDFFAQPLSPPLHHSVFVGAHSSGVQCTE